jgi:poly-gamma-glutamate synthesis protein (capsule biosynthesis protein)
MAPVLCYEGGVLKGIDLVPISLGRTEARHRGGRPRLAEGEEARKVLERVADLAKPFSTVVEIGAQSATVSAARRAAR